MSLIHPTFASTPPVTQEKGGVLVQRTTLDSKKILSRHNRRAAKGGNHAAECYLRCAAFALRYPRPIRPDLAALWLSSRCSPSLFGRSVTAVAVLCYRKRCGPGSAATSSTLLTHHGGFVQGPHHMLVYHSSKGGT